LDQVVLEVPPVQLVQLGLQVLQVDRVHRVSADQMVP